MVDYTATSSNIKDCVFHLPAIADTVIPEFLAGSEKCRRWCDAVCEEKRRRAEQARNSTVPIYQARTNSTLDMSDVFSQYPQLARPLLARVAPPPAMPATNFGWSVPIFPEGTAATEYQQMFGMVEEAPKIVEEYRPEGQSGKQQLDALSGLHEQEGPPPEHAQEHDQQQQEHSFRTVEERVNAQGGLRHRG